MVRTRGHEAVRPHRAVLRDQTAAFLHRIDPLLPGRNAAITEIVSSCDPAYAIRANGTVRAWGWNQVGQLGNGTRTDSTVPVRVSRING